MGQGQSARGQTHTLKGNHFDFESLRDRLKGELKYKKDKKSLVFNKHQKVNVGFQILQQNRKSPVDHDS